MRTGFVMTSLALAGMAVGGLTAVPAHAGSPDIDCKLSYSLSGWSIIYKHVNGHGTVTCDNGQSMRVAIKVRGGGLTAGKWDVDDGVGTFSDVHSIDEVLGDYVQASANAGVVKSSSAQALTKGEVSLVLAGTGEGVNLGVDLSKFTITRQ